MAVIGSTIGQPSFYASLGLATAGEPGYSRTAGYIGGFNGMSDTKLEASIAGANSTDRNQLRRFRYRLCHLLILRR